MARASAAYVAQLEALRSVYASELARKGRAIANAAAAAAEGWHPRDLDGLYRLTHRLTGSAAIFGFPIVSQAASALEGFVIAARQGGPSAAERGPRLRALAATLEQACGEGSKRIGPPD